MSNSFGIVTINNGRPKVLELWCAQINRLRTDLKAFIPAVVVSGAEDEAICTKYSIRHITQKNVPVTAKWNTAFRYMRWLEVDYTIILGSDDIMATDLLIAEIKQMNRGISLIGVEKIYFYAGDGAYKGQMTSITGRKILAPAKVISKKVLDNIDWVVCPTEKNWGMDAIMDKTIRHFVGSCMAVVDGMVVDVKTKVNLNSFRVFARRQTENPQEFYKILSEKELELLKKL